MVFIITDLRYIKYSAFSHLFKVELVNICGVLIIQISENSYPETFRKFIFRKFLEIAENLRKNLLSSSKHPTRILIEIASNLFLGYMGEIDIIVVSSCRWMSCNLLKSSFVSLFITLYFSLIILRQIM